MKITSSNSKRRKALTRKIKEFEVEYVVRWKLPPIKEIEATITGFSKIELERIYQELQSNKAPVLVLKGKEEEEEEDFEDNVLFFLKTNGF